MLVLRKREFLVNEVEFRLGSKSTNDNYTMTEAEFYKAVEELFLITNETQVRIAYRTALAHSAWDAFQYAVPITKLAHVAAYYCLMQIVNELQENLQKIVNSSKQRLLEAEAKYGPGNSILSNLLHQLN